MTNGGLSFGGDNKVDLILEFGFGVEFVTTFKSFGVLLLWVGVKYDDTL